LNEWYGLPKIQVFKFCESADILLNISGVNPLRDWHANIPIKIFLDTDPMFTQVKLLQTPTLLDYAKSHSCHFTIAENIGQPDCTIPTDVFDWKATKQPVVLDIWDLAPVNNLGKWTTIMSWKSYKPVIYNNEEYGMKNKSFNPYLKLPRQMPDQIFELGISSNTETKDLLQSNGWNIIEAITPTITPWTYRDYVNNSKGEWSIAKEGFVKSRSGFLSERTMNYMASGKPAVIEDTAFSKYYPTGEGLLCFSSIDECIEGIKKINLDYAFHCRKARQIVEETCNHPLVLTQLLEQAT
jgi:hypothetical protein